MMQPGRRLREIRGKRSGTEFVRDMYDRSGVMLSVTQLYAIENGQQVPHITRALHAIVTAEPEMAAVFLPANMYEAIVQHALQGRPSDGEEATIDERQESREGVA